MSDRKIALFIWLLCTAVYATIAGQRLLRPSSDTHFVYQAESWLAGRLDLVRPPPHQNDWAEVEYLKLRDGSTAAGQFLRILPGRFRTLDGRVRPLSEPDIASRTRKYYVSFPPFPAVLLLPWVALFGQRTNDVVFTVLLAGMVPALFFLVLRRLPGAAAPAAHKPGGPPLAANGSAVEDRVRQQTCLWLVGTLAFGSVFFFSSVIGQVWFTAHVVSLLLCGLFFLGAIEARSPALAGLAAGALFLTRPQMAALGLVFVLELLRAHDPLADTRGGYPLSLPRLRALPFFRIARPLLRFLVPCALLGAAGWAHNYLRFGRLFEFGHTYLTTMQADNIQRYGLMNYQYLPRNLAAALCLLPKLLAEAPYVQISYHGLALWFTTPALFYLLWPERDFRSERARALSRLLAICILPIALAGLLYQNDGYIQFGYRFSLDYMMPLLMLLFLVRPHGIRTLGFRSLVIWGVLVNLFGAITFGRMWQFYFNGFFPVL